MQARRRRLETTMSVFDGTVSPTMIANGRFAIGAYSHINGSGAELSGFVVTRHELEQVARYWLHERLEGKFVWHFCGFTGSYDWRLAQYSTGRLDVIEGVLGQ